MRHKPGPSLRHPAHIDRLQGEVQRTEGKLGNEKFVGKAPAEVVEKEKAKLAEARTSLASLLEQKAKIERL